MADPTARLYLRAAAPCCLLTRLEMLSLRLDDAAMTNPPESRKRNMAIHILAERLADFRRDRALGPDNALGADLAAALDRRREFEVHGHGQTHENVQERSGA